MGLDWVAELVLASVPQLEEVVSSARLLLVERSAALALEMVEQAGFRLVLRFPWEQVRQAGVGPAEVAHQPWNIFV